MGKRFKKHCKGICWKKSSSDSDVEDDSKGKIVPAKEDSSINKSETQAVQYGDIIKSLGDINAKLDNQDKLNTEAISNYSVLYKELVKEVKSVRQHCARQEAVILSLQKKLNDVTAQLEEVKAANDKPRDESCHVDQCVPVSLVSRATGPDIPYTNVGVSRDGIDQSCSSNVASNVGVSRDGMDQSCSSNVASNVDVSRDGIDQSCSSNVASQPPSIDIGVQVFDLPHSKKEMRTIACGPEEQAAGSNVAFKPSMVDTGIHASYLYLQPSLKNWNVTTLDLYCKGQSVRDQGRLQKGASRHGFLLGNPKSKLSKYDPSPPPLYSTKNNRPSKQEEIPIEKPSLHDGSNKNENNCDDPLNAEGKTSLHDESNKNKNNCDGPPNVVGKCLDNGADMGIVIANGLDKGYGDKDTDRHALEVIGLQGTFASAGDEIRNLTSKEVHAKMEGWTTFNNAKALKRIKTRKVTFSVNEVAADIGHVINRLSYFDLIPNINLLSPRPEMAITLRDLMGRCGDSGLFTEAHARYICMNIMGCLRYLHRQGTVHSSMLPNSVVFNAYGYPSLMLDRKVHGPKIPPRIESCSPEEITSGQITMATGIFQTGLLVYSLLYGRSPHRANTYQQTKENLLNDDFVPEFEADTISTDGRDFIRSCLRTDPALRFKVVECTNSLGSDIKWFSMYKVDGLTNQTFDSPFKDLLLEYT